MRWSARAKAGAAASLSRLRAWSARAGHEARRTERETEASPWRLAQDNHRSLSSGSRPIWKTRTERRRKVLDRIPWRRARSLAGRALQHSRSLAPLVRQKG